MARSKSQLSVSLANGVIIAEHLNHIQLTREMLQPKRSYPIFINLFVTALTGYSRRRLFEYLGDDNIDVEFYKRCQVHQDLTVGSEQSQRRGDINRQNNRICYQLPGQQGFAFATLLKFIKVIYPEERYLAWVRNYNGIDIDHVKRVASFAGDGSYCWIEATWIKSLFGVIRDGGVNCIITDVNLFD
jgi:hypothetical protein